MIFSILGAAVCLFTAATKDHATTIFVIGDSTAAKKDTTGGKVEPGSVCRAGWDFSSLWPNWMMT